MKPTPKLVSGLTVFLTFSLFTLNCLAIDVPIRKSETPSPTGPSRAPFCIPVTVSYTEDELSFNFLYSIGIATITVTDEYGIVVYQETTDTSTQPNLYIPIDMWDSGDYSIEISYGSRVLIGSFGLD